VYKYIYIYIFYVDEITHIYIYTHTLYNVCICVHSLSLFLSLGDLPYSKRLSLHCVQASPKRGHHVLFSWRWIAGLTIVTWQVLGKTLLEREIRSVLELTSLWWLNQEERWFNQQKWWYKREMMGYKWGNINIYSVYIYISIYCMYIYICIHTYIYI
jgi:hypothetical protein